MAVPTVSLRESQQDFVDTGNTEDVYHDALEDSTEELEPTLNEIFIDQVFIDLKLAALFDDIPITPPARRAYIARLAQSIEARTKTKAFLDDCLNTPADTIISIEADHEDLHYPDHHEENNSSSKLMSSKPRTQELPRVSPRCRCYVM